MTRNTDGHYVRMRIGYADYLLPIEQAHTIQRAMMFAVQGSKTYAPGRDLFYGTAKPACEVYTLDVDPIVRPQRLAARVSEYITCLEAAVKIHSGDAPCSFPEFDAWLTTQGD